VFRTHELAAGAAVQFESGGALEHWDRFTNWTVAGLMMYGQMTAGSWIYIGTQGILQGTYETFAAATKETIRRELSGKLVVTGGMGAWRSAAAGGDDEWSGVSGD